MATATKDETNTKLDTEEIELVLRRFASEREDSALNKLINGIFTETADQKLQHENSAKDPVEDKVED